MTIYITLLSSAQIGHDEWLGFLHEIGAEHIDMPHNPYEGMLMREQGKIWVGIDNGVVEDIDPNDQQVLLLLGGKPESAIMMEISATPGSRELALEFARRFAEHWPCMVEAERKRYSSRDLLDLHQAGRPFLTSESQ